MILFEFYLATIFVWNGEDPHDGVTILADEVVHVLGEHGLPDHGDLEAPRHHGAGVEAAANQR